MLKIKKKCINNLAVFPQIQNLPIERFWLEANTRVNYPIKVALVDFDNRRIFDIDNMVHRYCVSLVTCKVASFGLQTCIAAWNEHPIPGKKFHIYGFRLPYFKRMSNFKPECYRSFSIILQVSHNKIL